MMVYNKKFQMKSVRNIICLKISIGKCYMKIVTQYFLQWKVGQLLLLLFFF